MIKAIAASGTITLEVAYFGAPMVILYRASRLAYNMLGRWLIRTPHLSLVNILAGRELVPELMPWHGNVKELTAAVMELMEDLGGLVEMRSELLALADSLACPRGRSASANAADLIVGLLEG